MAQNTTTNRIITQLFFIMVMSEFGEVTSFGYRPQPGPDGWGILGSVIFMLYYAIG